MEATNSKIIFLEKSVIDKIAAGEVIERPASIVKELLENSIDAASTRIFIEISAGGKKLIKVSDNGLGMTPEEARISRLTHTTSKIKTAEDLFKIGSLGFRGEALSSIAAVSRLEMLTKSRDSDAVTGFFLRCENGQVAESYEKAAVSGTTIWVKDLFYNLPVRRKFLKKDLTELSYINETVDRYILAYPEISFELIINGTTVVKTTGRRDLTENLAVLYGSRIRESLKKIAFQNEKIKITGLVTDSSRSWVSRSYQNIFLNRRPVKSFLINRMIDEAYQGLLPKGRYPLAVIFIEMPAEEVDVNIHPKKSEVRFLNTSLVLNSVSQAIKAALGKIPAGQDTLAHVSGEMPSGKISGEQEFLISQLRNFSGLAPEADFWPEVVQFLNTYLIFIKDGQIALVDQHAASERINFEKLSRMAENPAARAVQKLLTPSTIEAVRAEANILKENLEIFNQLGFEIELFGAETFILRGVPAFATCKNPAELLENILKDLSEAGLTRALPKAQEQIIATIACHSAVRAGDPLNPAQIQELLAEFFAAPNSATCPHGRPTIVYLSKEELEKKFFRKM